MYKRQTFPQKGGGAAAVAFFRYGFAKAWGLGRFHQGGHLDVLAEIHGLYHGPLPEQGLQPAITVIRDGYMIPQGRQHRHLQRCIRDRLYAWHMSPEVILLAAEYAAGDSRPFSAMERRVRRWHESGVRSVAAAQADHAQENTASGEKAAKPPVSRALRPPQRTYTAEDLKHLSLIHILPPASLAFSNTLSK